MQFKLDTIANNLANANTTGFKESRVNFQDLYYQIYKLPGAKNLQGQFTAEGIVLGTGTRVQSTELDMSEGPLIQTGGQLDLAIVGNGFFQIQDPVYSTLYTRAGNFSINQQGQIVMSSSDQGRLLFPNITIPQGVTNINISSDGIVTVQNPGQSQLTQLGEIQLAYFFNPQGLLQMGQNLYQMTDASGNAITGTPGQNGLGTIQQGFLENSNVEPVQQLVDLITTQRTFELNSQVVNASDQILQLVANLRRF